MSTRCQVKVEQVGLSWKQAVTLYHHCDGYPSNMLPLIKQAFVLSGRSWEAGRAGKAASYLCAADPGQFEPEEGHLLHGDIEYYYVLQVRNNSGASMAESPSWHVQVRNGNGKKILVEGDILELAPKADEIEASI